ncbi:MAG: cupin domain-containing protein [Halosimplex sp.]
MDRVAFDSPSDPDGDEPGVVDRRGLSDPLGTTDVAINRYRIPPGEGFPSGLHAHADQEEVFVVLKGRATFEHLPERTPTRATDDSQSGRELTVAAGEAVRFAPGEYQSGYNRGDEDLVALALGAPRETTDVRVPVRCPECADADLGLETGGDGLSFACPSCGAERAPAPCPECGSDAMALELNDERRVVAGCRDCAAAYETPPYRE